MNDLISRFSRPDMSRRPTGSLLDELSPSALVPGVPSFDESMASNNYGIPAMPEQGPSNQAQFVANLGGLPPRDQFNFSPTEPQQKQALFSSLARMGAAMLANNRGPGAGMRALGAGLGAQQEGYQGALQQAEAENSNAFKSQMLRDQFAEQTRQRELQQGLRQAIGQLDQNDPNYWSQVGRLYAAAGDMDTALKAQELAAGGKPTEAQRNFNYLKSIGVPESKALGVFTPMAPQPLQYVPPTENRPGGFVDTRAGTTNFNEPPIPAKQKEIPATAIKEIATNRAVLTKYDNAITALENAVKTGSTSLGAWNYLGDTIRQRTDPQGVALRGMISEIKGQIFHDRSGGAVTPSEAERLKPYVPNDTDDPSVALTKLKNLRAIAANETNALADLYATSEGYKPLTPWQSPRSAPKAAPPAKAVFGSQVGRDLVQQAADKAGISYEQMASVLKSKGVRIQ